MVRRESTGGLGARLARLLRAGGAASAGPGLGLWGSAAVASDDERALLPAMDAQTELPVAHEGLERAKEHFARRQREPLVTG